MGDTSGLREWYRNLVGRWELLPDDERTNLLDGFALSYAYNSGKIENDEITYHDTREVFEKGRVVSFTGDVRTLFEIQNLKTSWQWARETAVSGLLFDEDLVLRAHRLLTYGTYDERRWVSGERPGTYKRGEYVVGVHGVGSAADDVPAHMDELFEEVNAALGDAGNALTVAAYLHAGLVDIHPFADGNGRVARLLMNMVLLSMGAPPIAIREQDRIAYYGALDVFHDDGDLVPFREFLYGEALLTWSRLSPPFDGLSRG